MRAVVSDIMTAVNSRSFRVELPVHAWPGRENCEYLIEEFHYRLVEEKDGRNVNKLSLWHYKIDLSPAKIEQKYGIPEGNANT